MSPYTVFVLIVFILSLVLLGVSTWLQDNRVLKIATAGAACFVLGVILYIASNWK